MTIEEISPELFTWELYNANLLHELSEAFYTADSFGYCDSSRLAVRPKEGMYGLMITWEDGTKHWCHITDALLIGIKERIDILHKRGGENSK